MVRLFKILIFALVFTGATLIPYQLFAQSTGSTPTPTPNSTPVVSRTATPTITATATRAANAEISATTSITSAPLSLPSPTDSAGATVAATSPTTSSVGTAITNTVTTTATEGPLQGTILANRSDILARFFLEGQTYQLEAGQSRGMDLPRATTVLNLFNCDGSLPADTPGCYWDPYLIQQDGFYEIYDASGTAGAVQLMLREAGAPPSGQVWVQNRTGKTESIVFKEDVFEVLPTAVMELPVAVGVPAILYVRSCLSIDSQSACEWAPKTLDAGVYYAMLEVDTPGAQVGSRLTTIELRPVVGDVGEAADDAAPATQVASPPVIDCAVVVPALNIRSGPGLQYEIIGKVRSTDGSAVAVTVTGRSADNEWLTVDSSVAVGGWINNSPSFITCSGDIMGLPVVEAPAAPIAPPVVAQPPVVTDTTLPEQGAPGDAPVTEQPGAEETATPSESASDSEPAIPAGQALLVVNNGFQHEMRFTLDQVYRPVQGPSEFDLQPGQSIAIVVFPGDIPFTGSSPWSGLSGNASLHIEPDQSLTLWLRFEPETGGTWVFRWN